MTGVPWLLLLGLPLILTGPSASAPIPPSSSERSASTISLPGPLDPEFAVVSMLVNRHRERVGCLPLVWHEEIAAVAQAHSRDMEMRDYYDHVDPNGEDLQHRLSRGGITWNGIAGENLAIGTVDGRIAFILWMDSPRHRAIIENCAFTHHGLGLSDGRWTHVFVQDPLH